MVGSQLIAAVKSRGPFVQSALCLLLFIIEVEIVEIALRNYYDLSSLRTSVWAPIIGKQLYFFNFVVAFPAILLLLLWPRLRTHSAQFTALAGQHSRRLPLTLQISAYCAFATLTYLLSVSPETLAAYLPLAFFVWGISLLATAGLALLTLAPWQFWMEFFKQEKVALGIAVTAALSANYLAESLPMVANKTISPSFLLTTSFHPFLIP